MIRWILVALVVCVGAVRAALPPDVQIARFWNDAKGAYSLTFDDGLVSHIEHAVPILDRHGLRGTFFLFTDYIVEDSVSNWAAWRAVAERGHEVASHSRSHLNLDQPLARSVLDDEIAGSARIIEEQTGVRPISFAYPYSSKNDFVKRLVLESYLFDRADCRVWGGDDFTVEMGIANIERAIERREWEYVMLHGVGEDTWGALDPEQLDELAAYLAANAERIWTDTYARIATYVRKRNAAEITRRNVTKESFEFRLRLPDRSGFQGLPDMPLTVRIPLEGRPAARVRAKIGDVDLALRNCRIGDHLLADVPANGQWVRVYW